MGFDMLEVKHPPNEEANITDMEAKAFTFNFGIVIPDQIIGNSVVRGIGWSFEKLEKASQNMGHTAKAGGELLSELFAGIGNVMKTMNQEKKQDAGTIVRVNETGTTGASLRASITPCEHRSTAPQ